MWKKILAVIAGGLGAYLLKKYFEAKSRKDFSNMTESEKTQVEKYLDSLRAGKNIIIFGENAAGKTSLIKRLKKETPSKTHSATKEITKELLFVSGLGGSTWPFYPFGNRSGIIAPMPISHYAIEVPYKDKEIIGEIIAASSTLCYVFNAEKYSFTNIALDLGYAANIAKSKGAKLRILGTFGNLITKERKDSILQEIKANLASIYGEEECAIFDDMALESSLQDSKSLQSNLQDSIESNATDSKDSNLQDSKIDSKDSNTESKSRAPFPKNENKECKIAIFELIDNVYNKDADTNATLLSEKLSTFLNSTPYHIPFVSPCIVG